MFVGNSLDIWINKLKDFHLKIGQKWAIYGTGNGADIILQALKHMGMEELILCLVDNDNVAKSLHSKFGLPVFPLAEIYQELDGIIIGAVDYHEVVCKRVQSFFGKKDMNHIQIVNLFGYNSPQEQAEYVAYLEKLLLKEKSSEFVEICEDSIQKETGDPIVISWYLPQYHEIEINNQFHGKGFTEWTNTTRAYPLYTGHYQPHIPYDLGYYNLNNIDTFKRQIFLAHKYGIDVFCFHYYWFSGKRIMEKPLEMFLHHKELDMPFCINWANENWTALWDGNQNEIMYEQRFMEDDGKRFMEDILPYMRDERYFKISGKPVIVLYRPSIWEKEKVREIFAEFRTIAKKNGFPDLYILLTNARGFDEESTEWGADALVEFPPHVVGSLMDNYRPKGYLNPNYIGVVKDANSFIHEKRYLIQHNSKKYFRSALVSWDNTSRKATTGASVYEGLQPNTLKIWLKDIILESKKIHENNEHIVFVNSWNEWAEGSHLEPDMRYGYAFLQAVREAIEETRL